MPSKRKLPIRVPVCLLAVALLLTVGIWTVVTGKLMTVRGGDGEVQHLPSRAFSAQMYRVGHLPLWNPYESSGIPHAALLQPGAFYPPNIVLYIIFRPAVAYNLSVVLHFLLAALFVKRYLHSLGLAVIAQALGTVTFAFSGFMIIHGGGGIPIFNAVVWIPAIFYCAERWIQTGRWKYPAWGGVCLALPLLAGWAQLLVLSALYLAIYVLFALPASHNRRRLLIGLSLTFIIAAFLALPQALLTIEFKKYTSLQALNWDLFRYTSYPPQLLLLLLFPCFFGPGISSVYKPGFWWGPPDSAIMTVYTGVLPLMLAAAAFLQWKSSRAVRFSVVMAVVALLMAFGAYTPLGYLLFHLPVFNLFHDHWVSFIFFDFAVAVLAACAVGSLDFPQRSSKTRKIWSTAIPLVFLGVAALTLIESKRIVKSINTQISPMPENWMVYFRQTVKLNNPGVTIPIAMLLISACFFWLWAKRPHSDSWARWAVVLVAFDLILFGSTFITWTTPGQLLPETGQILSAMRNISAGAPFRTISLQKNEVFLKVNANSLEGDAEVLGYEPFLPYPYADLLGLNTGGSTGLWRELLVNNRILSALNVRYVLVQEDSMSAIKALVDLGEQPPAARRLDADNLLLANQWKGLGGMEATGEVNSFNSDGESLHGVAQRTPELAPNTIYELSFKARVDEGKASELVGVVKRGQHIDYCHMGERMLDHAYQPNTCLVLGPELQSPPENPEVVFFTQSRATTYLTNVALSPVGTLPIPDAYRIAAHAGSLVLIENHNVLPRVYFVSSLSRVPSYANARSELWQMTNSLDLRNTALVEDPDQRLPATFVLGNVKELRYEPNEVDLQVSCTDRCFLVLSDQYFPGWHAMVNGEETKIYRTNGVVQGVLLPPGVHDLKFIYRPQGLLPGLASGAIGLLLVGGMIWADFRSTKRTRREGKTVLGSGIQSSERDNMM